MDDDSELHFALHNTYCAEHGKRLSECIPCSRIAVNAALAAEREAILSAPGRDEDDFDHEYRAWWDKYYRPLRDMYPEEAAIRARRKP